MDRQRPRPAAPSAREGLPRPKPLGLDGAGREVLEYIEGRAATWPWPEALIAGDGVAQIGGMLRACHRAVADFAPAEPVSWRDGAGRPSAGEIILHGDFGPYNLIWREGTLVGAIDWDLARPGLPIEEAAFAAIHCVPLRPDRVAAAMGFQRPPDRRERLIAFARAYGAFAPRELIAEAIEAQARDIARIERLGGAGLEPWATFLASGLARRTRSERRWLQRAAADIA